MYLPFILLGMALLIWPALYVWLILHMRSADVAQPPWLPLFFLFGTLGGWILAFALSPSGLAAVCIVFLMTIAPLSLLISSLYLVVRQERSVYHRIALWGGFAYPALLAILFLVGNLVP